MCGCYGQLPVKMLVGTPDTVSRYERMHGVGSVTQLQGRAQCMAGHGVHFE